jgi:hypothetical protein
MEIQGGYNPGQGADMFPGGEGQDMTGYREFQLVETEMMTSASFSSTTGCCATGTCN